MLCRKVLGRGFDSRRLHTSLRNFGRSEVCRAGALWAKAGSDCYWAVRSYVSARHKSSLSDLFNGGLSRAVALRRRRMKFYYVYILQSEIDQKRFYTGFTEDLDSRLKSHNTGGCYHTSKYRPWRIKTAIAFNHRQKALDFEKYLKSPSGRAFAKKRL